MTPNTRTKIPWLGIIAAGLIIIAQVIPEKLIIGSILYVVGIALACYSIKVEFSEQKKPNILSGIICILISLLGAYLMQISWTAGIITAAIAIWAFFNITELNIRDENEEGLN